MTQPITEHCLKCQAPLYHDFKLHYLLSFKKQLFPVLCHECEATFKTVRTDYLREPSKCDTCGFLLTGEDIYTQVYPHMNHQICYDCKRWLDQYPLEMLFHETLFPYNETLQQWLLAYKTQGDILQAHMMSDILREYYQKNKQADWLVLPSSPKSLEQRQFHATGLLLDLAEIPYACPFNYIGDSQKQAQKKREARLQMAQPFELQQVEFEKAEILIFDDVYTTGTTLLHAKRLLHQAFPEKKIKSLTIAR